MKKLTIALLALAAAVAAQAKTADDLRIYINPGHGSWTPNDRPATLVGHGAYDRYKTDTTSFFESNTNLRKGFGLLEKLRTYGLKFDPTLNQTGNRWQIGAARDMKNNIVMSHVKCGPFHSDNGTANQLGSDTPADIEYYNRSLSEISAEVDANHFDMFISIHSNAASEGATTNYPLYLYRGFDTPTQREGADLEMQNMSRAMADACWEYSFENPHMVWTNYSMTQKNLRGDCNFYSGPSLSSRGYYGYLGVLKHGVPGFLVEGYFHTYQPARHRAMNWDVDYMEGTAYAHGIADYFGLTKEKTGDIYGVVRDANERFVHDYYKPNTKSDDRNLPLNGVTAILMKDGKEVARYTTDNYYNGAFVFKDVEPGKYTITFESTDYMAGEPVEVDVKAASISYPSAKLVSKSYVPATVEYTDYPDPMASVAGVSAAGEYALTAEYTDEPIAELDGKLIRRTIVRDGLMYILALDKPITFAAVVPEAAQAEATVLVYDLTKKAVVANVDLDGAAGSIAAIADIQVTSDGVLLACNATKTQYSAAEVEAGDAGRGTFVVYKWANDEAGLPTGKPAEWITTQNSGLWYRAYPSKFSYQGTSTEGNLMIAMPTISAPGHTLRYTTIGVAEGQAASAGDYKPAGTAILLGDGGEGLNFFTSPIDTNNAMLIDANIGMLEFKVGETYGTPYANDVLKGVDGRAGMFKYAGTSFLVSPAFEGENVTGVKLINLGKNAANATATTLTLAQPLAAVATAQASAAGEVCVSRDELTEAVTGSWINLYLVRDGKITKLTTKGVQQPQGKREMAYDVKGELGQETYTVTFQATGDAPEATLHLTSTDGEVEVDLPMGAVTKGENTFTFDLSELSVDHAYAWEVRLTSDPIAQAGLVMADASGLTVRGGVIPITDPEQESFGYVAVGHGANKGIDIYNPEGEKVATRLFVDHKVLGGVTTNQSNPIRGDELDGMAVFGTWGDTGYGAVVINPLDQLQEPYSLFAGDKSSSGCFIYNGVKLGGGTAGISFIKDEQGDEWLLSFSEDHENQNGSGSTENTIVKQHLSGPWQITEAPEVIGYKGLLANTNVDLVTYGKGVFASQVRGAGNNQSGTPCFAYIADILGASDITMTSADDGSAPYIDANTSGVAITKDGKVLAASLPSAIVIFDVTWSADGTTPTLKYAYTFSIDDNTWATMRFDAAGNLHVYQREGGYRVYSLPSAAPVAVTPASKEYIFSYGDSVKEISAAEAAEADAVYYNLQGVQVPAGNLTPGIYVKVAGTVASKVIVK